MVNQGIDVFIDRALPLVVELETELTKRPAIAPVSGGAGELDKAEFLESWLKGQGITTLERYDAPDPWAKGGKRPNLVATLGGLEDSPRLWIMTHLDVVPPGERNLWDSDPWAVVHKEGRLFGRGVEDNQQGLTASVIAALALVKQGIRPPHTVKLLFVADEEVGSEYGIQWLLKNQCLFKPGDMVLVPDGGDCVGATIEIAEKNLLWLRCQITGVQAHGSRPHQGVNAHLAAADLALSLHTGLSQAFPQRDPLFVPDYSTFEPTKHEANVPNINTIPGEEVFYMDMRILPQYTVKTVMEEVHRIKAQIEAKYRVRITGTPVQTMESLPTPADTPLAALLSQAVKEVYRVDTRLIGVGGGTVSAHLRNAGIPAVVWSRLDNTAHQPNEYAILDNILGDAKVMARLMSRQGLPDLKA
ncbi:MAG: M20 family metallo-hydrolase [Spirochaetaceae bacterium]|jgi:succinyl-diaminopimelate desuccinylase|nr:M20 family metallo-hydrolase [Spirochaetaceae bacterium]